MCKEIKLHPPLFLPSESPHYQLLYYHSCHFLKELLKTDTQREIMMSNQNITIAHSYIVMKITCNLCCSVWSVERAWATWPLYWDLPDSADSSFVAKLTALRTDVCSMDLSTDRQNIIQLRLDRKSDRPIDPWMKQWNAERTWTYRQMDRLIKRWMERQNNKQSTTDR